MTPTDLSAYRAASPTPLNTEWATMHTVSERVRTNSQPKTSASTKTGGMAYGLTCMPANNAEEPKMATPVPHRALSADSSTPRNRTSSVERCEHHGHDEGRRDAGRIRREQPRRVDVGTGQVDVEVLQGQAPRTRRHPAGEHRQRDAAKVRARRRRSDAHRLAEGHLTVRATNHTPIRIPA